MLSNIITFLNINEVTHLCLNSKFMLNNSAFLVLRGSIKDGTIFIDEAINKGAKAFLIDDTFFEDKLLIQKLNNYNLPFLFCKNLKELVNQIAEAWYGNQSNSLDLIGITGTNGKTTTTNWVAWGLNTINIKTGTIGTLGCLGLKNKPEHIFTTPDTLSLFRWLNFFKEEKSQCVVMEVTSHALHQHRLDHIAYEIVLFTNLSRDHLDYHGTYDAYADAKNRLFFEHRAKKAVINIDDAFGQKLVKRWREKYQNDSSYFLITYGISNKEADLTADVFDYSDGLKLRIRYKNRYSELTVTNVAGIFNASNILGVIGVWLQYGLSWEQIMSIIPKLPSVPGRMNKISNQNSAIVIVDYAHTPDALEKVLQSLKPLCNSRKGNLWVIFGAGGDRDKGKRPIMGSISVNFADKVIITSDNPRTENPESITQDIFSGIETKNHFKTSIMIDRKKAIIFALENSSYKDVILIAGKGHEDYQEINGIRYYFSDTDIALEWMHTK